MTRGASVLFVGILSVMFLHRKLWLYQYVYDTPHHHTTAVRYHHLLTQTFL
jgi:inner membrane protein involved in colicin E2 resistance